ncbi:MAG TPA: EAL domain-containing protein [Acidimicrobiales bacterium]|nr:EAL domain-containing protein [Acidimicrobiales bacterium]
MDFDDDLLHALGEAVIITDLDGRVRVWNGEAERLYGWPAAEVMGRPIAEVVRPVPGRAPHYDDVLDEVREGERWSGELDVYRRDGSVVTVVVTDTPLIDDSGAAVGIVGVSLDVSRRRAAERMASRRADQHAAIARFGHWVLSGRRTVNELLSAAGSLCCELFGVELVQFWLSDGERRLVLRGGAGCAADVDRSWQPAGGTVARVLDAEVGAALVIADGADERFTAAGEPPLAAGVRSVAAAPLVGPDGAVGVVTVCSPDAGHFDGIDSDVLRSAANAVSAAIVAARHRTDVERQALTDPLTRLPNRILFADRLRLALRRIERSRHRVGVLYCDVDHFKAVNDTWGHRVGDDLLVAVADRLAGVVRPSDTVARLGGDEFGVLCEDIDDDAALLALAHRISEVVGHQPVDVGPRLALTVSVGGALSAPGQGVAADLLSGADTAMYRAKQAGPGNVELLDPGALTERHARLELGAELAGVLGTGALRLAYLPVVGLSTTVVGVEALLRWDHPTRGVLHPLEFLGAAADGGLMPRVGDVVVRTALEHLAGWQTGHDGVPDHLALNLSAAEVIDTDLLELVARSWRPDGGPALWVEMTEASIVADRRRVVPQLRRLAEMGVHVAIDDYGVGGSSLVDLAELRADVVKIDPSLVSGAAGPGLAAPAVVGALVSAAHALGVATVAEGVETVEQAEALADLGCGFGQGRRWGEPLAAHEVVDWVCRHRE